MARPRLVCGLLALGVIGVISFHASVARSRPACGARVVRSGPVFASGCWRRAGRTWRAAPPVTLDGLKLTGGGTYVLTPGTHTIASTRPARWLIGPVQFLRAPVHLLTNRPFAFSATGAMRGLPFTGAATLAFVGRDGGTARLSAKLAMPGIAGGAQGAAVLTVSRRHGFDVRSVHVAVGDLALGRLLFEQLDFRYAANLWSAQAAVRLPAFLASSPTLGGHIDIANGALRGIGVDGSGLSIPLGEGLVLTKVGLDLGLSPLVIQGKGTATYGPPIAGASPLEIDGGLEYTAQPERWVASGTVSLPWGLPGVKPKVNAGLELHPGRAMIFTSDLNLSVHGIGVTGSLDGFASPNGFNAIGAGSLKVPLWKLDGKALVSSRGMSACGEIRLLLLHHKLGFGYRWGGALSLMGSSCDVGAYAFHPNDRLTFAAFATPIELAAPGEFAVFRATGGDFNVTGPTGSFDSTADHDDENSFAYHDPTDGTTYLAIPALAGSAAYTVTPLNGATLTGLDAAGGLVTHAGSGDVTAGVTPGSPYTLTYGIDTSRFAADETVSFFQGQSPTVAGAEPIVEDVRGSGSATFAPEPLGDVTRYVFAVVSIDGLPREQFPVATFEATPVAPPSAAVFLRSSATAGWTVLFGKPQRVAVWQLQTVAADGTRTYQEVPGTTQTVSIPATAATPVVVDATPVDQFGRTGPTYACSTATPGQCPAG